MTAISTADFVMTGYMIWLTAILNGQLEMEQHLHSSLVHRMIIRERVCQIRKEIGNLKSQLKNLKIKSEKSEKSTGCCTEKEM